jgi:hypothetical protein
MTTLLASIKRESPCMGRIKLCATTLWADEVIRPLHRKQMGFASLFRRKTLLKIKKAQFFLLSH